MATQLKVSIGIKNGKFNGRPYVFKERLTLTPDQIKSKLQELRKEAEKINRAECGPGHHGAYYASWDLRFNHQNRKLYLVTTEDGLGSHFWAESDEQAAAVGYINNEIKCIYRKRPLNEINPCVYKK